MDRVSKVTVAVDAAAAAIVDALMPNYAAAQQVSPTDARIKTELRDGAVAEWATAGSRVSRRARPAPAANQAARASSSSTRTAGSIPTSRTWRVGSRSPTSWRSRPTALTSVGGYPGDDAKGGELFGKVDRAKMAEDLSPRRCG